MKFAIFLLVILALGLYFLPTVIAFSRKRQIGSVLVLNFFLGWTLVGWVAALAIASSSQPAPTHVNINPTGNDPARRYPNEPGPRY